MSMLLTIIIFHVFGATLCGESFVAPTVTLRDDITMPQIAFGTWLGLTSNGNKIVPQGDEVEQAVAWAIDAGYRHFDTAAIYDTEEQVGLAVIKKIIDQKVGREKIFITTKLWNDKHGRDMVVPALKESLKRLNMRYVDLYLIHWPIGHFTNGTLYHTDYVETWQGMVRAKQQGLARAIGLSNFNQQQVDRIYNSSPEKPSVLQVEVNLNLQQPDLLGYCKRKGIVVTAFSPFGSLFPGRAKPGAPPPRVNHGALVSMAKAYNKTVPQIVLRYLVELGAVPMPRSMKEVNIEDNIKIFDFKLSDAHKKILKSFDKNYRTFTAPWWKQSIYYPF